MFLLVRHAAPDRPVGLFSVWLPPVGVLTLSYLAYTVLEPSIKAEYNVDVKWWIWVIAGSIEILIMVALAINGLVSTGPGWAQLGAAEPRQLPPGEQPSRPGGVDGQGPAGVRAVGSSH